MSVGEICNRNAVITGKSDSIYHAAKLMRDYQVNYLVVVESQHGNNIPVGAISEHEIVVEIVAERLDLDTTTIGDVMQSPLLVANETDDVMQTLKRMRHNSVCCVPIINADHGLTGILTIDDILDRLDEVLNDIVHILSHQQMPAHEELFSGHNLR